jgi:alkyl hydroperoxide reductase subunit D
MQSTEYRTLPAHLRMTVIGQPGVERTDFELWSLVVSAINGCGACLDAHETELRRRGLPGVAIQAGLRIAAVVNAASRALAGEAAAA